MVIRETALPGMLLLEPPVFGDERGWFRETWRQEPYEELGLPGRFVQDNAVFSRQGVLRGLHYQWPNPQGKLVSVLSGTVFDVGADIRRGSPHFGRWEGWELSAENGRQLYIPPGFAHGYVVTSEYAVLTYKCTEYYDPQADAAIAWNDPTVGVVWPVTGPTLSVKDGAAPALEAVPEGRLPVFPDDTAKLP